MSSGDVALEISSARVTSDSSSRAGIGTSNPVTQQTRFTGAGPASDSFVLDTTRTLNPPDGVSNPETLFDSSKRYKITFTEV